MKHPRLGWKGPRPLSLAIIKMRGEGRTQREIAKRLKCSEQNVAYVLRKYQMRAFSIAPITQDRMNWLHEEAKRSKIALGEMARALLIDAIDEAMEESK